MTADETPLAPTQCPCRGWAGPGWPHVRGAAGCQYAIADETPLMPPCIHSTEPGPPSPPSEQGTAPDDRQRLARGLMDFAATAPLDELFLLAELKTRILRGRATYGDWTVANERRDLDREQLEEHLDGMVYGAMRTVKALR